MRLCSFRTLSLVLTGLLSVAAMAGRAEAYPYLELRPADQVIGGPADGFLSSLHYNPAGLRLNPGSHLSIITGARGYLGSYRRSAPLPAGFAPGQTAPEPAEDTRIGWVNSAMMIAGNWDLATDRVTLGFGLFTPYNDETSYGDGDAGTAAQRLSTRYHALYDRTYSLWGTVAAGFKITPWLNLGAGFQFAWSHSRLGFFTDFDTKAGDQLSCAGVGPCERWQDRTLIELDVSGWGYGFTAGVLAEPIVDRLWIGLSYLSPLLTSAGTEVGLFGQPQRLPWQSAPLEEPCGPNGTGVRVTRGDEPAVCGAAHMARSFPHLIYLGIRGHLETGLVGTDHIAGDAENTLPKVPRSRPKAIEISSWARLTVPSREPLILSLERRVYAPGQLILPLALRTAFAMAAGVREIWPHLILAEELLYESPRTDPAAVSPANLEGHKLDLSLSARIALYQKSLWLLLTVGVTGYFLTDEAGSRFSPEFAGTCRAAGYDVTTDACQKVQDGYAVPSASGAYFLMVPHGVLGLEVKL